MPEIQVVNRTRGTVLGGQIRIADRLLARMRGLLFRPEPGPGQGLLLSPCQGVHMIGMRFPLDVVFVDEMGVVVAVHPGLRPWRWTPLHREAAHAIELPAGTLAATQTQSGDSLSWARALPGEDGGAATGSSDPEPDRKRRTRRLA